MIEKKLLELNGVEIYLNKLYGELYVKEIKSELEAEYGVKLSRKTQQDQMNLVCGQNKGCPFCFRFVIESRFNASYYRLVYANTTHMSECIDAFKAEILKRKRFLEDKSGVLKRIMRNQYQSQNYIYNPKELFQLLLEDQELKQNDFFGNPEEEGNKSIRVVVKKKFDNMVADIKKEIYGSENLIAVENELTPIKKQSEEMMEEDDSQNEKVKKLNIKIMKSPKMKKKNKRKKLYS